MKLSQTLQYINQALNYPALTYLDIELFMNTAISELNTILHISLPSVSQMKEEFEQIMSKRIQDKRIRIEDDPTGSGLNIQVVTKYATHTAYSEGEYIAHSKHLYIVTADITALSNQSFSNMAVTEVTELLDNGKTIQYYFNEDLQKFGIWYPTKKAYEYFNNIYGTYVRGGKLEEYVSYYLGHQPIWIDNPGYDDEEFDLEVFLPDDWVYLWLIPYVCYKYTCRDGGTAQTFAEELTQGFQQLQDTYDIPSKVVLSTVADKMAYTELVEENLPHLNIVVPVRALYEDMKHSRNINRVYGGMNDRGGFL